MKATLANHECILLSLAKFPLVLTAIDFTQLEMKNHDPLKEKHFIA